LFDFTAILMLLTVLGGQFMITQLPTIFHIKDGEVREYGRDDKSVKGLTKYLEVNMWIKTDPIPWYKSPTSLHMYGMGWLFQLAQYAQKLEEYLRSEYNLPTWGIFTLVAAVTVVVGLTLGLVCVLITELISRMRRRDNTKPPLKPQVGKLKPIKEEVKIEEISNEVPPPVPPPPEEKQVKQEKKSKEQSARKRKTKRIVSHFA
jgi:hypothetical protein